MASSEFSIFVAQNPKVSEPLLGLLGFVDQSYDGSWVQWEANSAVVNDMVHALTDIGYRWVVTFDYTSVLGKGIKRFETLDEWTAWYEDDEE